MDPKRLLPGDSTLVENIVNYLKAKGIFDEFRHECLADVDTKSSCQNLSQRVDGYTSKFLANETWHPDLNKNELRNKLRRHIDESGMLAVGADHVVEQVINPKIHQLFLPKIIEVVHQYMKEQNELLNKKPETAASGDNTLSENISDTSDTNKTKTSITDPIADILSFSYSKTKPTPTSSTLNKTDNILQKHTDVSKIEKKKEEKISVSEKSTLESPSENPITPVFVETKLQTDKEKDKIKKDEHEAPTEVSKKAVKEEIKSEKKKVEDAKIQSSEASTPVEENKVNTTVPIKSNISGKKDIDKNKQKSKSVNTHKTSNNSSEVKKPKKESSEKSTEKQVKSKPAKPIKESPSPTKSVSSVKSVSKDEKGGEISKTKSSDSNSSKASESSLKKSSKSSSCKKDSSSSKHKGLGEKAEKYKNSKSDKNEQNPHESINTEKGTKHIHYSSSYDSSQGSDQEKSSSSSSKLERQKHFSKHAKKESSEKHLDKSSKASSNKKRPKDGDESPSKKHKSKKSSIHEKFKETILVGEAAKISSRSNSFGSTSSVSSSSNMSKDNLISNSDETLESSGKDKKKKQAKEKDPCHNSKTLPPPPPPPPPSSSLSCELTSSAEMSSIEDTQSSSDSENSSSEELSEESSSDSESESKESVLNILTESALNSSMDDINDFYDIFLYSSSSSEFEGYGDSPGKRENVENVLEDILESDISISSVHTSDLSSYDDELSDDDFSFNDESQPGRKKKLTLKEAQELIQRKVVLQSFDEKNSPAENKLDNTASLNERCVQMSSSLLSSEDESSPSKPTRSLRRERKLNPRYASSEYTSIFNSRKETFITKQTSPFMAQQTSSSSPNIEIKYSRKESDMEKDKLSKENLIESKMDASHQDIEMSIETKSAIPTSTSPEEQKELSDSSQMTSSDEMDSIVDEEKFQENNKPNDISGNDQLKFQIKFKPQNNSKYNMNSYPVKRKLIATESTPTKRPCSRSSVDSSSSEFAPNENKPFNSEKQNLLEEKIIRDSDLKVSDLTDGMKKDLFCRQRTNNNGDILGQKDIFPKNSRAKTISTPERKTSESETSKELNAL